MKLRTKMMLGAPAMLVTVMIVSVLLVSWIVYRQQKESSRNSLDTSFGIIRQDIAERMGKLSAAALQMTTAKDLGSKVQFISETMEQGSGLDFTLFRSDYLEMADSILDIASTAGIHEVRVYNMEGRFLLGMDANPENRTLVYNHDEAHKGIAILGRDEKLTSGAWEEVPDLDPEMAAGLEGDITGVARQQFFRKNNQIGIACLTPVVGAVYNAAIEDFTPKQFGVLLAVRYFDKAFVDKTHSVAGTEVNIFVPGGLALGTLSGHAQCDFAQFPPPPGGWTMAEQEIFHSVVRVDGKGYFQAVLPLYSGSQCLSAVASLTPMAVARANTMQVITVLAAVFLGCLLLFFPLSIVVSRSMFQHIGQVAHRLKDISEGEGDLTARIAVHTMDEIGELAASFNTFIAKVQTLVRQIKEGAEELAQASSEISSTASELSVSSVQTSTTVLEISTTAEEVKQTTLIASEKAENVAAEAEATAQISTGGQRATEEAIVGMGRIKEEMECIAESIVKLSEHTQSIGEIINAVNDLANESNLLSVNASIEAAKAGDYGKGFGVVAQEVKSLSDQSRQATAQIKAILHDIQNATGAAVMATERGAKAVDQGEALAARSGDAIKTLTASVAQASDSATQISATSKQQLAGMGQLAQALDSITDASSQNTEAARQLETATNRLHSLGRHLKDLAGRFKV